MKVVLQRILQESMKKKYLEHQTLGCRFICPIGPATEREFILDWRILGVKSHTVNEMLVTEVAALVNFSFIDEYFRNYEYSLRIWLNCGRFEVETRLRDELHDICL